VLVGTVCVPGEAEPYHDPKVRGADSICCCVPCRPDAHIVEALICPKRRLLAEVRQIPVLIAEVALAQGRSVMPRRTDCSLAKRRSGVR